MRSSTCIFGSRSESAERFPMHINFPSDERRYFPRKNSNFGFYVIDGVRLTASPA